MLLVELLFEMLGGIVSRALDRLSWLTSLIIFCVVLVAFIFFCRWLAGDTVWLQTLMFWR